MARVSLAKVRKLHEEARALLQEEQYSDTQEQQTRFRSAIRFLARVWRSFSQNRGPVRAAALAYTTLLALIPMLALIISVSTGALAGAVGTERIDSLLDHFINAAAPQINLLGDEEERAVARGEIVEKIKGYVANVNSGTLGASATIALIFVGISLLSTIEGTFNDIWGVRHGRAWSSRVLQYWATLTLGPIFLLTALGLASALAAGPRFATTAKLLNNFPILTNTVFMVLPFVIITLTFTAFYKQLPNTKVHFQAALVGGVVGGCLWQLNNLASAFYASRVVTYSKVYGSISVVPILLLGLYFSWLIVLFGAQTAYAYQNRITYLQEKQAESINQRGREFAAMRIMTFISQRFLLGARPPTRTEMATDIGVPTQLSCQLLACLAAGKLVSEVQGDETGFAPARPLEAITVEDVLESMRSGQGNDLATNDDAVRQIVKDEFTRVVQAERAAAGSVTLQDLAARSLAVSPRPSPAELMPAQSDCGA